MTSFYALLDIRWGYMNQNRTGPLSNDLQRLFVSTISNTECIEYRRNVSSTEICTLPLAEHGICNVSK